MRVDGLQVTRAPDHQATRADAHRAARRRATPGGVLPARSKAVGAVGHRAADRKAAEAVGHRVATSRAAAIAPQAAIRADPKAVLKAVEVAAEHGLPEAVATIED